MKYESVNIPKQVTMTEDDFYEKYNPIKNPFFKNPEDCPFDGTYFETYGPELDFVTDCRTINKDKYQIWTIIEVEGNMYYVSGYHFVNRFGYLLTPEFVPEDTEIEVKLDNEIDEDNESGHQPP